MDIEILFLHTCDDLETRISSNDDYVLLGASKIIRQLFLDGDKSLVDLVNRKARIKLKFEVVDVEKLLEIFKLPGMPTFEFVGIQDVLDPDTIPNPPRKIVNRDDFFQLPLQISGDKSFTVREIVLHQANSMGGVHAGAYAGEPKDNTEKLLLSTDTTTRIFNLPPGLRQLKSIGQVVLKTLNPLRVVLFCSKVLETNPDDVAAYYNRGTAFAMSDKLRESINDFDKAIELANESTNVSDVYFNRAHTFLKLAILDFEMYLKHAPDSPEKESVLKAIEQLKSSAS